MFFKSLVCILLLTAIAAKHYSIDKDLNVEEISKEDSEVLKYAPHVMATTEFIDDLNSTGWTYFTVHTNQLFADSLQTYSAGYLEGYLAYNYVWTAWKNNDIDFENSGFTSMPANVSDFIHNQTNWALQMIRENPQDHYWNLVNATISQLRGTYDGFIAGAIKNKRPDLIITFDQFYLITYDVDLADVVSKFIPVEKVDLHYPRCSFLLKMTEDDLYVSHTTWSGYFDLIRTYKVYNFNLNNPLVNTKRLSLSSQPGSVASIDDWYIVDNNRVVTETTIGNENDDVYSYIHFDSLPYWIRVTVANLAFTNQKSWADVYYKYRSGTYGNQWLLIDFNNYNASKGNLSEAKDIIWMVEEFYSLTSAQDVTQQLLVPQGYVASYNVPYNATIQELSQDDTNYTTDARYHLFKKYAPGIKNFEDFKFVMRLNNVSDTGDVCDAIASRCDLDSSQDAPWGAIDCKVTSSKWVTDHQAWIISSPTTSKDLPPFTWDNWPEFDQQVASMPEIFEFDWVFLNPPQNFSSTIHSSHNTFETLVW